MKLNTLAKIELFISIKFRRNTYVLMTFQNWKMLLPFSLCWFRLP